MIFLSALRDKRTSLRQGRPLSFLAEKVTASSRRGERLFLLNLGQSLFESREIHILCPRRGRGIFTVNEEAKDQAHAGPRKTSHVVSRRQAWSPQGEEMRFLRQKRSRGIWPLKGGGRRKGRLSFWTGFWANTSGRGVPAAQSASRGILAR